MILRIFISTLRSRLATTRAAFFSHKVPVEEALSSEEEEALCVSFWSASHSRTKHSTQIYVYIYLYLCIYCISNWELVHCGACFVQQLVSSIMLDCFPSHSSILLVPRFSPSFPASTPIIRSGLEEDHGKAFLEKNRRRTLGSGGQMHKCMSSNKPNTILLFPHVSVLMFCWLGKRRQGLFAGDQQQMNRTSAWLRKAPGKGPRSIEMGIAWSRKVIVFLLWTSSLAHLSMGKEDRGYGKRKEKKKGREGKGRKGRKSRLF